MNPMYYPLVVAGTIGMLALSGCGDPKVDTSTADSMKNSISQVRNSLPADQYDEFDKALQILAFKNVKTEDIFSGKLNSELGKSELEARVRNSVDGKTGQQIIDEADQILAERKKRELDQAKKEIQELENKKAEAEVAKDKLALFKIKKSRFYKQERHYGNGQPIIELTVENGTDNAIARAYFEGTLASPERSVPWLKESFNYQIAGGLEPGEQATWSLAPNRFSDWGKMDIPSGAVFTVTVEQLDGANNEPLYSVRDFSEYDKKRLEELKSQYGDDHIDVDND
ncbi:DUF6694 family lipoprotein [Phytohalomonas tamaricis]|uniref:DUF6694 family lipoprotein n=1 Tax=Phytohalomonas tamaricis TaxID=2081032 RepID=UPI0021D46FEB|nr:DUF6694 family lipoprotein [Phytohalomonas tamaricis]